MFEIIEITEPCGEHIAKLFFRLLLKNTVCSPLTAAYAYFWRSIS
ncbi:hypothetical protein Patl1_27723 [Pistacia atlantica]|uniref:Uncharacterized protein n=1 Tax=Pistacia atlantica TaxID=434234 RepID=A0ACC1BCN6_9ROSI|nr:hypothetical protein Patl1_27723 [Pistacia atlantica]